MTYHDPCYLARVNGVHQAPRDLLGKGVSEMENRREKTFCCGAGGGRMWMEEEADQRVSVLRAKEAVATGAETVAVGCPFCLTMMTDGVKSCGSSAEVEDVAADAELPWALDERLSRVAAPSEPLLQAREVELISDLEREEVALHLLDLNFVIVD